MRMNRRLWVQGAGAALAIARCTPAPAQTTAPLIFAAASLKTALDDIALAYAAQSGKPVPKISYAASNTLAKQIEQGAPADLFVSADTGWMDYAASKDLIRSGTRIDLLGNRLVLIAAKDSSLSLNLVPGITLAAALSGGRLAMANVEAVPAGKYGKAALEKLGGWEGVKDHLAQADNVRAALLLVARGEAPLGIVYQTDAAADPSVKIIANFPAESHPPIIYPAAVTKAATHPDAQNFLDFLRSAKARSLFEKQGFTCLAPPVSGS